MTQEEKNLLLKDLCGRLLYNVIINCTEDDDKRTNFNCFFTGDMFKDIQNGTAMWNIKPYLRPMSSMTEEEKEEYNKTKDKIAIQWDDYGAPVGYEYAYTIKTFDWLNSHHFDYRGLIKKGLAIEAPEGMYE